MRATVRPMVLAAVALCALVALPSSAPARTGAEDEYDLQLPASGADQNTPDSDPGDAATDTGSGGVPVLVIALLAGAGLAVGAAVYRMRARGSGEGPGGQPPDSSAP